MTPVVSVIVPSYQHAPYLRECIASVQAQTFTQWEVIVVDDQSKDHSVEVARSIEDPRVRVFTNEVNLGTYGTQNRGVAESRGRYIAVLNSDDRWHPRKLELQVARLEADVDLSLVYCLGHMIDDLGAELKAMDVHGGWPRDARQSLLPFLLVENRILASGVMVRREAANFDSSLRYSGDWVLLLDAARKGPLGCINEAMTYWRQHETNSYRRSPRQLAEEIRVRRAILRSDRIWGATEAPAMQIRRGLAECANALAALEVLRNQMPTARKVALSALRRGGGVPSLRRFVATCLPHRTAMAKLWPREPGAITDAPNLPALDWR